MRSMKIFLKSLMIVIIALSIAVTGIIYCPAAADADEMTDTAVTDDDSDDSEEAEDDEEDDDEEEDEIDVVVNFYAPSISKKSVKLKWDKVEDIDGYELSYKKASSSKWKTKQLPKSKTSFTVTKLNVNTKYNFRIRAFISYLDEEDDDDDEYYDDDADGTDDVDDEDDEDDEDDDEEDFDDYDYGRYSKMNLRTLKKNGSGKKQAFSDTYEKSAPKSIKVPLITKVKLKSGKVAVTWKKSAKAKGYEVYMSKKAKSRFKRVAKINKVKTVNYTTKKLKKGTTYYFKVRAFAKKGSKTLYTKFSKTKSIKAK